MGCGDSTISTVTGTVTYNGKPVPKASVTFYPKEGRPSSGVTDESGKYELNYTADKKGALIGQHTVRISTAIEQLDETVTAETLPKKFNTASELTREVTSGAQTIDFDLKD